MGLVRVDLKGRGTGVKGNTIQSDAKGAAPNDDRWGQGGVEGHFEGVVLGTDGVGVTSIGKLAEDMVGNTVGANVMLGALGPNGYGERRCFGFRFPLLFRFLLSTIPADTTVDVRCFILNGAIFAVYWQNVSNDLQF